MRNVTIEQEAWLLSLKLRKNAKFPEFFFFYIEGNLFECPLICEGKLVLFSYDTLSDFLRKHDLFVENRTVFTIDLPSVKSKINRKSFDENDEVVNSLNYLFAICQSVKSIRMPKRLRSFLDYLTFNKNIETYFSEDKGDSDLNAILKLIDELIVQILCNSIFVSNHEDSSVFIHNQVLESLRRQ